MKKLLFVVLMMCSFVVSANDLDVKCPQFSQGQYPVIANESNVAFKCMKRYSVAYDTKAKIPMYVVTVVSSNQMNGDVVRANDFYVDPSIATAKMSDYVGTKYDKGHLAEAELFTTDSEAMHESFCMCNMHTQWFSFNRGLWHALENHSHKMISQYGTVYLISGTVYGPKSITIGRGATVPEYTWKIIKVPSANIVEAYLIPNQDHQHENYAQYKVNVHQIEIATGLKF